MRITFFVTVVLCSLIRMEAREPWQRWSDRPPEAPIIIAANAEGSSAPTLTVADLSASVTIGADCSTWGSTNTLVARLRPHTEYIMTVTGSAIQEVQMSFKSFESQTSVRKRDVGAVPKAYKIFIDGVELGENTLFTCGFADTGCGSHTKTWKFEVRPDRGLRPVSLGNFEEEWRRDEDPVSDFAPGDALPLEIGPGMSTNTTRGAFRWGVSTGRLRNGNTAGIIRLQELTLSSNVYTASGLSYTVRSTNTDELNVVTNASGQLRQIKAPQTMVDIQATNGSCAIKFYLLSQIGALTNGLYPIITNAPFVTWRVKNPDGTGAGTRLQVIEERPGRTNTSEIAYDAANKIWSLKTGTGSDLITESRTVIITNGNRIEAVDISQGTNSAYKASETYHPYAWGWELTNVVTGSGTALLTNSFSYNEDTNNPAGYSQLDTKILPTGGFERWTYTGGFRRVMRPFQGSPATASAAGVTNSLVSRYDYSNAGGSRGEVHIEEYLGSKGTYVINDPSIGDDAWDPSQTNHTYTYMEWSNTFDDPGNLYELKIEGISYTQSWTHKKPGNYLNDMLYSSQYLDRHADFLEYSPCTYNAGNYSFVTNSVGPYFVKRVWKGQWDVDWTGAGTFNYGAWESGWNDLGNTALDPNRSTCETTVYQSGNAVLETIEVVTGADSMTGAPLKELISRYVSAYDSLGHLISKTWVDPRNTNSMRVVYSASWNQGSGDCELKVSEADEQGVLFRYSYDSLKRLTNVVRVGVTNAGLPIQYSIETNWTYNAAAQMLSETATSTGLSISRFQTFDLAGRPKLMQGFDGIATNITYSSNARITTNTMPGGVTRISEVYLDGRPKSLTGTAQIAEFYTYDITPDVEGPEQYSYSWLPKNLTRTSYGTTNSARWTETVTDLTRRVSQVRHPGGDGTIVTNFNVYYLSYYSDSARLAAMVNQVVDDHGLPVDLTTIYSYDPYFGTNSSMTVRGEPDFYFRTRSSETLYYKDGTNWFLVTTNYLRDLAVSDFVTDSQMQRLTGFSSSNIASQSYQYDIHTNLTVVTSFMDRANRLAWEVTDFPESLLNATNTTLNGLLELSSTASVANPTRYYYDFLGRVTGIIDPLLATTTKSYDTFGRLSSETDKTGVSTLYTYYSTNQQNGGLVASIRNPAGKYTRYDYNTRGQKIHTWGDVPYPEMRVYDNTLGDLTELRTFRGGTDWSSSSLPSGFFGTYSSTHWAYDAGSGLLTNKSDAATFAVGFSYYRNNLLKTVKSSRSLWTTNWYNEFGENAGKAYSGGGSSGCSNTTFNAFGLATQVVDASGTHSLSYDYAGRLTNDAYGAFQVVSGYNPTNGLVRRLVLTNGVTAFEHDYGYDFNGRLSSITNGTAKVNYGYLPNSDLVQSLTSLSSSTTVLASAKTWEYGDRLASISHAIGSTPFQSFAYTYDLLQRRTRTAWIDGSAWRYSYDDRDQLTSGKRYWNDSIAVAGQQFEYAFDSLGNRKSSKAGGDSGGANLRSTIYTNNSLNEIIGINGPSAIDVLGVAYATAANTINGTSSDRKGEYFRNELSVTNTSGPLAQTVTVIATQGTSTTNSGLVLVPKAQSALSYDSDGNLSVDSLWNYKWDAENRLIQMTNTTGISSSARKKITFQYDAQGRRTRKTVYPWGTSNWSTNATLDLQFVYADWLMLAEADGSNKILRSYTWGNDLSGNMSDAGGIGGLVNVTHYGTSTSTNFFVVYDGNGNVQALVKSDKSLGAVYEYSPFGELIRVTGPIAKLNLFRFSTKYYDDETSLTVYPARPFNSTLGRWITRDPSGEQGGINLYHFNFNDAISRIDPLGDVSARDVSLGNGWKANVQTYDTSGKASFEVHVYNPGGTEVGVVGANGWIAKHGKGISPEIPDDVYRVIKGVTVNTGRKTGQIAAKGTSNIKNWFWNGTMGAISRGGKGAGLIVGAVAINSALTSSAHAAETAQSYARNVKSGNIEFADLDAIDIAVDVQNATGNYFMSYEALDILLQ